MCLHHSSLASHLHYGYSALVVISIIVTIIIIYHSFIQVVENE